MLQNDYLMRMIMQLIAAIQRSILREEPSPEEDAKEIEDAVGDAIDIDSDVFFSLAPESIPTILGLGNFDKDIGDFVIRAIYYEASVLETGGFTEKAALRRAQADAICAAYDMGIAPEDLTPEAIRGYFAQEVGRLEK
jgi:hypothetical protein